MNYSLKILLYILLIACARSTSAQIVNADSTNSEPATHAINYFNKTVNEQLRLYSGSEYIFYPKSITGNAYLLDTTQYQLGAVNYDGIAYAQVPLMYDLYRDVVIVLHYNKVSNFSLINNRVSNFDLMGHHFVRIVADSAGTSGLNTGFYDQLYNGKSEVLVKRKKDIQVNLSDQRKYFESKTYNYIKRLDGYHSVSGQGGILKLFKDKSKDIKQYLKTNKIKYKDDKEQFMVKVASFYDHLSQ